jgi:hypothetical protein
MRISDDGGITWTEKTDIPASWAGSQETPTLYTVTVNGAERLLLITACPGWGTDSAGNQYGFNVSYSDDDGRSWGVLPCELKTPFSEKKIGLGEPGLYELENGELWMWCRTLYGHQYESRSYDNGVSWTPVEPNFYFTSPDAPMRVKDVGDYTVSVFNPVPCLCTREDYTVRGSIRRTPLVCAVSDDRGRSFDCFGSYVGGKKMIEFANRAFYLEDDLTSTYCYPAVIEVKDGFLAAYYHSNGGTYTLNCLKIAKVYYDEIAK